MEREPEKSISLNDLFDLIDLYKYASIEGEKVEFIINPVKEGNKRVVTIGLIGGFSRDRDTFVFDDGEEFDRTICPQLLSYFSHDDSLGNWDIVVPEYSEATIKGVNETQSGNVVYLETYNKEYFDDLTKDVEQVEEETDYKKDELTNIDKIWEEIIQYAKERRVILDFYKGSDFSKEQIDIIYEFIKNLAENSKEVTYGKSKKSKENNERYLNKLFEEKQDALDLGLTEEIYNRVINTTTVKKLSMLLTAEKRVRNRLDLSNEEINNRIDFATSELDKVNFFNLKNANIEQFRDQNFVESKPKAIKELEALYDNPDLYDEEKRTEFKKYCEEILEYLERKSKDCKKVQSAPVDLDEKVAQEEETKEVEPYESLDYILKELIAKDRKNDTYLFVFHRDENNGRIVEVLIKNEEVKYTAFVLSFADGEKFDQEIIEIMKKFYAKYPELVDKVIFIDETEKELKDTQDVMKQIDGDIVKELKPVVDIEVKKEEQKELTLEEKLERLNQQINDHLKAQEEKKEVKEQPKEEPKEKTRFNLMDIDLATYELLFNKYEGKLEDKFYNGELLDNEYRVVQKIYNVKNEMLDYYNTHYVNADTLSTQEIKDFATCEVFLSKIYEIESKYQDNDKRIEALKANEYMLPASFLLLQTLVNVKNNKINEAFVGAIVAVNSARYYEIMQESRKNPNQPQEVKDEMFKILTYQMKLRDAYDALILAARDRDLTEEEAKQLGDYEVRLSNLYNIEALCMTNEELNEALIEISKQENYDFFFGSKKLYINALKNESLRREQAKTADVKENESEANVEQESDVLFQVVEQGKEQQETNEIKEIRYAYEKAIASSTLDDPATIEIIFEPGNKTEADLVICNKKKTEESVVYRRTFKVEKLNKDIMPKLREIFAFNNELKYNIKFTIAGTKDACLLAAGLEHRTFKITNATDEFVDENKEALEKAFNLDIEAVPTK